MPCRRSTQRRSYTHLGSSEDIPEILNLEVGGVQYNQGVPPLLQRAAAGLDEAALVGGCDTQGEGRGRSKSEHGEGNRRGR